MDNYYRETKDCLVEIEKLRNTLKKIQNDPNSVNVCLWASDGLEELKEVQEYVESYEDRLQWESSYH